MTNQPILMQHSLFVVARMALALAALPCLGYGGVWIVDQNGSADFASLQAAVNAAQDGDTILVQPQQEERWLDGCVVDGKGLTILAYAQERLSLDSIEVRNLAAEDTFVLSGFSVLTEADLGHLPSTDPNAVGLLLENNLGRVRIQDCTISGTEGWNHPGFAGSGTHAIAIRSSMDVSFSSCDVLGGSGYEDPHAGAMGLLSENSMVNFYHCTIHGGTGGYDIGHNNDSTGGDGGDGMRVLGGALYLANCSVTGGFGGSGGGFSASYGGDGANGLSILNGALVQALDCNIELGQGGFGIQMDGQDGVAVRGPLSEYPGPLPELFALRPYGEAGDTVNLRVVGQPGADVHLLVARTSAATPLTPEQGFLHTSNSQRIFLGVLAANGHLVHSFQVPVVSGEAIGLHLQAATSENGMAPKFSNPYSFTALDGAFVHQCGGRVYVDQSALPGGDGLSWATAYTDLRMALNNQPSCANDPTEVWVAAGTYRPALHAGAQDHSFVLNNGVHLYGGFAGTETLLSERNPSLHPVTLTGDLNGDDLAGFQNRTDNSWHVIRSGSALYRSANVRLDGLIIRGGEAPGASPEDGGAGIQSRCDGLMVARCTIEDNRNSAGQASGAGLLQWRSGDTTVLESVIQGNVAGGNGAGIRIRSDDTWAAVYVANCVVRGNASSLYGGGLDIHTFAGKLTCTTVYANSALRAGGINVSMLNSYQVTNSVFWGNTDSDASSDLFEENFTCPYPGWSNLRYSCVDGWNGYGGPTNTGADPLFVDPVGMDGIQGTADDNLRVQHGSPCIDSGWNNVVLKDVGDLDNDGNLLEATPTDLDHKARFVDDPHTQDTGLGSGPLVDRGAYEHPSN